MASVYDTLKENSPGGGLAAEKTTPPNVLSSHTQQNPASDPDVVTISPWHKEIVGNKASDIVDCLVDKKIMPRVSGYWWGWGDKAQVTLATPYFEENKLVTAPPITARQTSSYGDWSAAVIYPADLSTIDPRTNAPRVLIKAQTQGIGGGVYFTDVDSDGRYNPSDTKARNAAQLIVEQALACVNASVPYITEMIDKSNYGSPTKEAAPKPLATHGP